MCVNPNSSLNLENVFVENCGQSSDTSWSGMPCPPNMDLRCTTMSGEVVWDNLATSLYRADLSVQTSQQQLSARAYQGVEKELLAQLH